MWSGFVTGTDVPPGVRAGEAMLKEPTSVLVRAGAGDYPVVVGAGALGRLSVLLSAHAPAHRYAVVADAGVARHHGGAVVSAVEATGRPVSLHTFPSGEASKSREQWAVLSDALLAEGLGRDGCVVALGGGVAGDLAGFVAATYMRGIPVVQLPTSLVAMIDSSVGGKTGVDVPGGKNLVGAFHPPRLVVADTLLALTLPREERARGLAEALKHGAIVDAAYLAELEARAPALLEGDPEATTRAVIRSVQIKADVVSRDEREGGLRQILNFGHTLGHSLEAASGYRISHGEAVARGMVLEARLGEALGVTAPGTATRLAQAVTRFGLPAGGPHPAPPEELVRRTRTDKKVRGGTVRYVLLSHLGAVARTPEEGGWSHGVEDAAVVELLESDPGQAGPA
jgi:3-dehydroquinate synthase